ncbi:RRXRR domain-containing protein, partial [Anaerobiospirillum succiniciproducens]
MDIAYVLDNQGNPLMPTKRLGRVRHLLQEGKA